MLFVPPLLYNRKTTDMAFNTKPLINQSFFILVLFPDDACTLSPPVFVDEQLRYHFGFYGSDMDSLCNTIEFHGMDTKEIYPNEFTMCFKNVWYRDPYCALSIKVLEGNKDALPKYVSTDIVILIIQIKVHQDEIRPSDVSNIRYKNTKRKVYSKRRASTVASIV